VKLFLAGGGEIGLRAPLDPVTVVHIGPFQRF
jgi:hypothetical protein